MKRFYGFEFYSGRGTTTGAPNETTGRMSIAGGIVVFGSMRERDDWVEGGAVTSEMCGNCREAVTIREARSMHLGMSVAAYDEMLDLMPF